MRLLLTFIFFFSCKSIEKKDKTIQITIEESLSYKFDVINGIITTFYSGKEPTIITYTVTEEEKNRIIDLYYDLGIDKMLYSDQKQDNLLIQDECQNIPVAYTFLNITKNNKHRKIQIARICKYNQVDSAKANKINSFIDGIFKTIDTKNVPESNIIYY